MFISILQHVPVWVFGLLVVLIVAGSLQIAPRQVTLRRGTVMPLVLTIVSLVGVVTTFGRQPLALLAWAAAVTVALALMQRRITRSKLQFDPATSRFHVPGSWVPLGLMLSLFAVKFIVGATLAQHAELAQSLTLAVGASALYGLVSGLFLSRAAQLWVCARRLDGGAGLVSA
jgi:hypothetical protein